MICEHLTDAGECGQTAAAELPNGEGRCMAHLADWIACQMVQGEELEPDDAD